MSVLPLTLAALLAVSKGAPPSETSTPFLHELTLDAEIGPAYIVQNDNRYGETGTLYTAADIGQQRNLFIARRISLEALLGERHRLIVLYAPFDLTTRVTLERSIDFKGTQFGVGEVIDHRYLFDGYRASYLFGLIPDQRLRWEVGASFQIRNASVEMRSVDAPVSRFAFEDDIGLVFALKTRLTWYPTPSLWTMVDADAISSFGIADVSGALYDVSLSLGTPVRKGADVFLRLRWLGGGADVPDQQIENWGNFFFATAGIRADLISL